MQQCRLLRSSLCLVYYVCDIPGQLLSLSKLLVFQSCKPFQWNQYGVIKPNSCGIFRAGALHSLGIALMRHELYLPCIVRVRLGYRKIQNNSGLTQDRFICLFCQSPGVRVPEPTESLQKSGGPVSSDVLFLQLQHVLPALS